MITDGQRWGKTQFKDGLQCQVWMFSLILLWLSTDSCGLLPSRHCEQFQSSVHGTQNKLMLSDVHSVSWWSLTFNGKNRRKIKEDIHIWCQRPSLDRDRCYDPPPSCIMTWYPVIEVSYIDDVMTLQLASSTTLDYEIRSKSEGSELFFSRSPLTDHAYCLPTDFHIVLKWLEPNAWMECKTNLYL